MDVVLFDYGTGNLHSLSKALEHGGATVRIEADAAAATQCDALVLPGVGAFGQAAQRLGEHRDALKQAITGGLPCLAICLGMQLLFDESEEGGGAGLGIIPGTVRRLRARRLPQMGWNDVIVEDDPLFRNTGPISAYYANSYVVDPAQHESIIAWSEYGIERFPAAVRSGSACGVQFHPEKSGAIGLRIIANFLSQARA